MSTRMIGAEEVARALNTSKGYAYKVSASSTRRWRRRACWWSRARSALTVSPSATSARTVAAIQFKFNSSGPPWAPPDSSGPHETVQLSIANPIRGKRA